MAEKARMAQPALRFVIQRHQKGAELHFDIMLERRGRLRTWSSPGPPSPGIQEARSLPDHRIAYLEHEGEVSRGRGSVRIWDRGRYDSSVWEENRVIVDISGGRLRGRLSLSQVDRECWRMEWASDE